MPVRTTGSKRKYRATTASSSSRPVIWYSLGWWCWMLSFVPNCFPDETGTRRLSKSSFDYRAQGQLRAHQHAGLDRRGVVHGSNIQKFFTGPIRRRREAKAHLDAPSPTSQPHHLGLAPRFLHLVKLTHAWIWIAHWQEINR